MHLLVIHHNPTFPFLDPHSGHAGLSSPRGIGTVQGVEAWIGVGGGGGGGGDGGGRWADLAGCCCCGAGRKVGGGGGGGGDDGGAAWRKPYSLHE